MCVVMSLAEGKGYKISIRFVTWPFNITIQIQKQLTRAEISCIIGKGEGGGSGRLLIFAYMCPA